VKLQAVIRGWLVRNKRRRHQSCGGITTARRDKKRTGSEVVPSITSMTDLVHYAVESVIDFQKQVKLEELPRPFMAPKVIAFRQRLGEYEHQQSAGPYY
jgi:hypothetical protein